MYNRILLPTDGSKNSEIAIEHALAIAEDENAEIVVLNVVDSKHLTSLPENALEDDAKTIFKEHSQKVLEKVQSVIKNLEKEKGYEYNVKISALSLEGHPANVIIKVCEKDDIDMVIMASSGKHIVDRFLLGSVTEKTVRHCPVPVLVIPANKS